MTVIMKGITCCADCAYYNVKKHRCTRATDEGKPTDHFYADCPLPTVTKAQGWVSVKDRMPESAGWYFVYAPGYVGGSSTARENHNGMMFAKWSGKAWSIERCYYNRHDCVKAWMNLPEPPKEDDEE